MLTGLSVVAIVLGTEMDVFNRFLQTTGLTRGAVGRLPDRALLRRDRLGGVEVVPAETGAEGDLGRAHALDDREEVSSSTRPFLTVDSCLTAASTSAHCSRVSSIPCRSR